MTHDEVPGLLARISALESRCEWAERATNEVLKALDQLVCCCIYRDDDEYGEGMPAYRPLPGIRLNPCYPDEVYRSFNEARVGIMRELGLDVCDAKPAGIGGDR